MGMENPKPKPKPRPRPRPRPKPHGPTSKGTPRAQKQNLDKSHENMAIKTKIDRRKNIFFYF